MDDEDLDDARSAVEIALTRGDEDGDEWIAPTVHSQAPIQLQRYDWDSDVIRLSVEADEFGGGFHMRITDEIARQLVEELSAMLADPDHPGFRHRYGDES